MKIIRNLLGALVGLTLVGCITLTPKGSIDLAYIPQRVDDHVVENEVMIELDAGLEAKIVEGILKNMKVRIGGRQRTFMFPFHNDKIWFKPNRQEYDFYGSITYENLKLYLEHICSHPIKEKEFWVYDKKNGRSYIINHDSITKIGIRLEF